MKTLFLSWLCLAVSTPIVHAVEYIYNVDCLQPNHTYIEEEDLYCGHKGTLFRHPDHITYSAFDARECAERCNSETCKSFGITPSTDGATPGTCFLYDHTLEHLVFEKNSSESTFYYDIDCYEYVSPRPGTGYGFHPKDGSFSYVTDPSSAWSVETGEFASGNPAYHSSHPQHLSSEGNGIGQEYVVGSHSKASRTVTFTQIDHLCYDTAYAFNLWEGDDGYWPAHGAAHWQVLINDVVIYEKDAEDGELQSREPVYLFNAEHGPKKFSIVLTVKEGEYHALEQFDSLSLGQVFRTSIPEGTTVIDI